MNHYGKVQLMIDKFPTQFGVRYYAGISINVKSAVGAMMNGIAQTHATLNCITKWNMSKVVIIQKTI